MKDTDKKSNSLTPNFTEEAVKPFLHENHKQPRTRREFLAQGFIGMSASVILPSFGSLVANTAYAQDTSAICELPQFKGGLPYLCIDVAGGMNIAGANAIVGIEPQGALQEDVTTTGWRSSDYIRLGITPEEHPNLPGKIDGKYGLKFHRASGLLQGLNEILDGERMLDDGGNDLGPIEDAIDGLVFCTRTSDDTATNQINTVYMANKAGAQGELIQLIGNTASETGARSAGPADQINLSLRPTQVLNNDQASGLLSLGAKLSSNDYINSSSELGQERVQKFMGRIAKMSKTKLDELSQKQSLGQIQSVLNCSYENAKQLFQVYSEDTLNPMNDPSVAEVFQEGSQSVASVAKLVLDKISGAGTITIGGGDYHNNPITTTHAKDVQVGRAIGQCILLAAKKRENVAIHLYTDGGVAADSGGAAQIATIPGVGEVPKVIWTGDSGTRSSALLLFYKHGHDGSSMVKEDQDNNPMRQIGNFRKAGGVELSTVIGNSTVNLWKAIMLNYLAAQGREAEFTDIFGAGSLPPEHEDLIRMKPIMNT